MTSRTRARAARAAPTVAALVGAGVALLGPATPAAAHASLIATDPVEGTVLDEAPERITLTFDEPVGEVPDGVQVFDAEGTPLASSPAVTGAQLEIGLDEPVGDGTLVVAWRVLSGDGHPISGSLTFSVGEPSATVAAVTAETGPSRAPPWLSLTRWAGYLGLLLTAGLTAFAVLALSPRDVVEGVEGARRRVVRTARAGAVVAVAAWLAVLPLTASYQLGTGLSGSFDTGTWAALPAAEYAVAATVVVGLVAAVALLGDGRPAGARGPGALVAASLAAAAPALTGHPRAASPPGPALAADVLHLLAGGVWLGGLVGLALVLPVLSRQGGAGEVLARFSGVAAGVLAVLVAAGSVLAWQVLGSWGALWGTGYGRLLLLKVGIAAVAVLIAGWNRYVLVPRLRRSSQSVRPGGDLLARSTAAEAAILAAVVLVTGFLVDTSPEVAVAATPAAATADGSGGVTATLGDVVVVGDISPRTTGPTTVTIRLQHPTGGPAEGVESLSARLASDDVDLGEVPLAFVAPGSYAAEVVLPAPGTWRLQVSVRRSEFVNPVTTLEIPVPGR